MSVMDKIFGLVKPAAPNQTPAQTQLQQNQAAVQNNLQAPPNTNTAQSAQTASNGLIPEGSGEKPPESPVAKFETLWEPPKPVEGENKNNQQTRQQITAEQMLEAAGKVDFTKVLDQETLQKISAGGQDAVNAMVQALNKTAQNVFAQSTLVTQKLIERENAKTREEFNAQLPSLVKKQSLSARLVAENPAFAHPAVAPMITALQSQLQEKYPKATEAELQTLAKEYLTGVAGIVAPSQKQTDGKAKDAPDAVDWDQYLLN
jgi:hypothetical protein